jgi:serine/threonine protein kinase
MPAPANAEELLDLIQKSGVVDEAKLRTYVQKLTDSTGLPKDPAKLASHLVRDAVLTYFQAEQLLQGKYKRFSIGKYKVLEKLGAGGMAQVFLCEHKLMRRRVAIKVLPTAKAEDPASLDRFYREAKAIAAVDHPNIVRAYDIDQDENLHFLVMEYVDGTNLQDLVKKFGPLDITRACHYIYGSAIGLQHAHENGLIHRDIKPGNILIDRTGVVKILDMGLARFFHDEDDVLTKKYDENVLGTADYLAPEQALDSHTVDIRADIYSLGATFYYLLTGSALFPEGSVAQKLIWHQSRLPRSIRSLRPEVPEEIVAIVDRMMAKEPAKRFQTPAELLVSLAPWVTTPIPPPSEKELPQVSPAAGGLGAAGGNRVPATRSNGPGTPDAPTVVASSPANTPTQPIPQLPNFATAPHAGMSPQTTAQLPITNANHAVWESLDTDTPQALSRGDTDRTVQTSEPVPRPRKPTNSKPRTGGLLLYLGIGVLVLAGAAAGTFIALFKKPPLTTEVQQPGSRKIVVSTAGGDGTVKTLHEAISIAKPGDKIVILEPRLTDSLVALNAKHKDVTIESGLPDGKSAIIEFNGAKTAKEAAILTISMVEGIHLKNIEFDGKNAINNGIVITGVCPGCTFENVTVQKVKSGIVLQNARGEPNAPIILERIRTFGIWNAATPTPPAVPEWSGIGIHIKGSEDTKWVKIRGSRFEGPCTDAIRVDAIGATADLEITGNRFFGVTNAVSFGRPLEKKTIQAQFVNNTVCDAKAGFSMDLTAPPPPPNQPQPPAGKFDLTIRQNYFGKTPEIGKVVGAGRPEGIKEENNASDANSGGNMGINIIVPSPLPQMATDPNDDAKFLRFNGSQPEIGPGKTKVGAP